jgi:nicotinate-nucleotide adenylyltransferase
VGILGGTFDPPHLGHLVIAESCRDALGLDEVRFVVANDPWQKHGTRAITPARRRLGLVDAALVGASALHSSDIELELGGPSYLTVTLEVLEQREPDVDWHVIVGADAAAGLGTWHRPERLREQAHLAIVDRPGADAGPLSGWRHRRVTSPLIGVSSTMLRERVTAGRSIRYLTPDPVIDLIERWHLYRPGP